MTRDDVIRMACEAGIRAEHPSDFFSSSTATLESFVAIVRAQRDAELLAGVVEPSFRVIDDKRRVYWDAYTAQQVGAAVLREREECAKVCDAEQARNEDKGTWLWEAKRCASAIRARGAS